MRRLLILVLLAGPGVLAEDLSGKKEVAGFAAGQWLQDIGTKPAFGGSFGKGISNHALLFAEFSYVQVSNLTFFGTTVHSRLMDYQAGIKYTLLDSDRVEPYAILGAGVGHFSASAKSASFSDSANDADFGLHFGAGARLYIQPNWGLQPEVKYTRYFSDGGSAFRFGAGVFYRW